MCSHLFDCAAEACAAKARSHGAGSHRKQCYWSARRDKQNSLSRLVRAIVLLGDRLAHPPPQLLSDFLQLGPYAVPPGFPLEKELTLAATGRPRLTTVAEKCWA